MERLQRQNIVDLALTQKRFESLDNVVAEHEQKIVLNSQKITELEDLQRLAAEATSITAPQVYRLQADKARLCHLEPDGRNIIIFEGEGSKNIHARGFVTKLMEKGSKVVLHFEDGCKRVLIVDDTNKTKLMDWYAAQIKV